MKVDKTFLKSKTLWLSLLTIVAGFFPEMQELMKAHPEQVTAVLGLIFGVLRITSSSKIVIKEE
jgi:xanthine/uracil permease